MKEIQLTKGRIAIVDDEDYEWLNQWKWCIDSDGYAMRSGPMNGKCRTTLSMHRAVAGLIKGDGMFVDHKNGNIVDNRRENLRVCSNSDNLRNQNTRKSNSSGFKGVSFHKNMKKWRAQILVERKNKHIGYFSTPEAAHAAYCESALKHYGAFANFGNGCVILKDNDVSR